MTCRESSLQRDRAQHTHHTITKWTVITIRDQSTNQPCEETQVQIDYRLFFRIFISHVDHLDALTTLPEQEGPSTGSVHNLDNFNSQEIAYYLTTHSWKLYFNIHPSEFIFHVFGRHNFNDITSNLDLFRRHYNELQYWVITELLLEKSVSRRVQILKKFIKVAG